MEVTYSQPSITALLSGAAAAGAQLMGLAGREAQLAAVRSLLIDAVLPDGPLKAVFADGSDASAPGALAPQLLAPEITVEGMGCRSSQASVMGTAGVLPVAVILTKSLMSEQGDK